MSEYRYDSHYHCSIHNTHFTAEPLESPPEWMNGSSLVRCPYCQSAELRKLREENKTLSKHRKVLLEAIEIKETVNRV